MVSALCAVAEPVWTAFLWRPQLCDPADEMMLEAAINGNADALVPSTGGTSAMLRDDSGLRCCRPSRH